MTKYEISVYIFTRDLRLVDNTSLINASKMSNYIIPIFIFTPEQISNKNKYKSLSNEKKSKVILNKKSY